MSEKNNRNYDNPKSSLADIILVISKHLNLIIVLTILALLLTFLYVRRTYIPEYISTSKMFVTGEG